VTHTHCGMPRVIHSFIDVWHDHTLCIQAWSVLHSALLVKFPHFVRGVMQLSWVCRRCVVASTSTLAVPKSSVVSCACRMLTGQLGGVCYSETATSCTRRRSTWRLMGEFDVAPRRIVRLPCSGPSLALRWSGTTFDEHPPYTVWQTCSFVDSVFSVLVFIEWGGGGEGRGGEPREACLADFICGGR
jgi:hypothetical protein